MAARTRTFKGRFTDFKIILDDPASKPALDFDVYANAFAEIIVHSKAQFAIGIFGDWGSGKTTLMRAIERELASNDDVVSIWFNAWRYEKEEHLIVPLLDTLREGLVEWAAKQSPDESTKARKTASTVARAARAILAGLTVKAQLPLGVAEASFDAAKSLATLREGAAAEEQPLSFYHASFNAMKDAIAGFVEGERRRIVIFVDDLDRCLPLSALEVLESMKLFFDLEGFVFVVGLDQNVIERSIELKYQAGRESIRVITTPTGAGADAAEGAPFPAPRDGGVRRDAEAPVSGAEYVKKIFQVPFGLPRISTEQLPEYFNALLDAADLPAAQRTDLNRHVRPHLAAISGDASVNPREVKRIVNAYTLQVKMLGARLGDDLDRHAVMALLTVSFRSEWRGLYDLLAADPHLFVDEVSEFVRGRRAAEAFWLSGEPLPQSFVNYVRGRGRNLLRDDLTAYVTSVEAVHSSDRGLLEAQKWIGRARQHVGDAERSGSARDVEPGQVAEILHRIDESISSKRALPLVVAARQLIGALHADVKTFETVAAGDDPAGTRRWARDVLRKLDALYATVSELRRETTLTARS